MVAESSGYGFFPASTPFRCFRTSLLNTQWSKRTARPCRGGGRSAPGLAPVEKPGPCRCLTAHLPARRMHGA